MLKVGRLSPMVSNSLAGTCKIILVCVLVAIGMISVGQTGPQVSALSAIILDQKTGKVLWSKDPDTPRYPASTTKIMTALLLIEHCRPEEMIKAPDDVETVQEASLHLKPGEQVSAREMLYALMLRSANDGCYAVAVHISGSVGEFAKLMNARAKQIGCTHTHFDNPHGLNDENHTISARDLGLIACEAMKYPEFREVVKTYRHKIVRSMNQEDLSLVNKNKWLKKDPTADGIKTGWTVPAGHCYVGSATRNGFRVVTVVMKSDNWETDHQAMLDWAFTGNVVVKVPAAAPSSVPVAGGVAKSVAVAVPDAVGYVRPRDSQAMPKVSFVVPEHISAPIVAGQPIGTARYSDETGWKMDVPLVAAGPVAKASLLSMSSNTGPIIWIGFAIGAMLIVRRQWLRKRAL